MILTFHKLTLPLPLNSSALMRDHQSPLQVRFRSPASCCCKRVAPSGGRRLDPNAPVTGHHSPSHCSTGGDMEGEQVAWSLKRRQLTTTLRTQLNTISGQCFMSRHWTMHTASRWQHQDRYCNINLIRSRFFLFSNHPPRISVRQILNEMPQGSLL
jgi:hypothetical protein